MVRGISSFSSNKASSAVLKGKTNVKNVAKHIDLPAKIALGSLGTFYTTKTIGDASVGDTFVMKCSDYDSSNDTDTCNSDYWCGLTYP